MAFGNVTHIIKVSDMYAWAKMYNINILNNLHKLTMPLASVVDMTRSVAIAASN